MECFKQELVARERCAQMNENMSNDFQNKGNPTSSSTLHSQFQNKSISCSYCKGNHPSNHCNVVTDVSARKRIIQAKNKCFNCLKSGHRVANCYSNNTCYRCKEKHHISLCNKRNKSKNLNDGDQHNSKNSENEIKHDSSSVHVVSCQDNVLLQIAHAYISHPVNNNKTPGCILFDNCSQKSFVTGEIRQKLSLPVIRTDILTVKVFGETCERAQKLDVVKLKIQNSRSNVSSEIEAYVVPVICSPISNQRVDLAKERYNSLRRIQFSDDDNSENKKVDILVGANYYWNFATGRLIRTNDTLTAVHTILGWTLNGNIRSTTESKDTTVNVAHVLHVAHKSKNIEQLSKFWEIEDAGISNVESFDCKSFIREIKHDGERYSVPLPWKSNHEILPDNYENSKSRLLSLFKRLKREPDVLKQYDEIIRQQKNDGIIEKVNDTSTSVGKLHYLPHHGVIKEDKSTSKLRVVYDASSNSPSLNDCLEKGPCLLPLLVDILIRFGAYKVAVASDIKQAFLNVSVNENERNFLRFLWFDDVTSNAPNVVAYRYTRVIFGMNSSQFLLSAAIMKHLQQYEECDPDFVENFLRNLYVDDSTGGGDTTSEVIGFYRKAKSRLLEAGLNLRKWRSNDVTVSSEIVKQEINEDVQPDDKILGILWDTDTDNLSIDLNKIYVQGTSLPITKRNVLKTIASMYDPLGIISPLVIPFKIFFQKLCVVERDWDIELDQDLQNE